MKDVFAWSFCLLPFKFFTTIKPSSLYNLTSFWLMRQYKYTYKFKRICTAMARHKQHLDFFFHVLVLWNRKEDKFGIIFVDDIFQPFCDCTSVSRNNEFIFSIIFLLTFPILLFAGLISGHVSLDKKFILRSFSVMYAGDLTK